MCKVIFCIANEFRLIFIVLFYVAAELFLVNSLNCLRWTISTVLLRNLLFFYCFISTKCVLKTSDIFIKLYELCMCLVYIINVTFNIEMYNYFLKVSLERRKVSKHVNFDIFWAGESYCCKTEVRA